MSQEAPHDPWGASWRWGKESSFVQGRLPGQPVLRVAGRQPEVTLCSGKWTQMRPGKGYALVVKGFVEELDIYPTGSFLD